MPIISRPSPGSDEPRDNRVALAVGHGRHLVDDIGAERDQQSRLWIHRQSDSFRLAVTEQSVEGQSSAAIGTWLGLRRPFVEEDHGRDATFAGKAGVVGVGPSIDVTAKVV